MLRSTTYSMNNRAWVGQTNVEPGSVDLILLLDMFFRPFLRKQRCSWQLEYGFIYHFQDCNKKTSSLFVKTLKPCIFIIIFPQLKQQTFKQFYKWPSIYALVREKTDVNSNYTSMMEDADPEVKPGLFQGDMAMTNEIYDYWRIGLRWDVFEDKLWDNGIVPYTISPLYGTNFTRTYIIKSTHHIVEPSDHVTIYKAIRTINYMTCVKFVPWDGKVEDYLLIWPIKYPAGCWSFVGKYGGSQIVSLQPPDKTGPNCLGTEGRAMHELMHALGVFHEQSRWDRDKFVKIHMENIIPSKHHLSISCAWVYSYLCFYF